METIKRVFSVDRKDIGYLQSTIESYDGIALVRTLDPYEARIEIGISPGCEGIVMELLESLRVEEGFQIRKE